MRIRNGKNADPDGKNSDPGSGMEKIRIRDKHPGSVTLYKDNDNCRLAADPRAHGEGE